MQEGRARYEIDLIHRRISSGVSGINQLTESNNDVRFRLRAIENIINRNWFLRTILGLGVKKVKNEVAHLYQEEALAREAEDKARTKIVEAKKKLEQQKVEQAKQNKLADKQVKKRERQLKKELKDVK